MRAFEVFTSPQAWIAWTIAAVMPLLISYAIRSFCKGRKAYGPKPSPYGKTHTEALAENPPPKRTLRPKKKRRTGVVVTAGEALDAAEGVRRFVGALKEVAESDGWTQLSTLPTQDSRERPRKTVVTYPVEPRDIPFDHTVNPWHPEHWNKTHQGLFFRKFGEQHCRDLALRAGVDYVTGRRLAP